MAKNKAGSPIYHHHVQKSGGTSINFAFLRQLCDNIESAPEYNGPFFGHVVGDALRPLRLYEKLGQDADLEITVGNKRVVGHRRCSRDERFYYWFSHSCAPRDQLPDDAYQFTCFRNPYQRLLSFLTEVWHGRENGILGTWGFERFGETAPENWLDLMERKTLLHQVYLFSPTGDVAEAANAINQLDRVIFTESFADGLEKISGDIQTVLPHYKIRAHQRPSIDFGGRYKLLEALEPEYDLLDVLARSLDMPPTTIAR